jgi:hypothetical protein
MIGLVIIMSKSHNVLATTPIAKCMEVIFSEKQVHFGLATIITMALTLMVGGVSKLRFQPFYGIYFIAVSCFVTF